MLLTQPGTSARDPFSQVRRLQADMNRLFDGYRHPATARAFPPVNLWVGDEGVMVTAELPGLNREDIDLTVHEDNLVIRGERRTAAIDNEIVWHRRERGEGTFSRTVELPFRIEPEKVSALFKDGVLQVELQRPQSDLPHKIEISTH